MGASETRLFTPNTTVRRISFRTLQPVGSSTNQVLRIPAGTDFTCSREYTPCRANAIAFWSTSVPKIFTSWFWKAGPIASASRMPMENASSPVADPAHHTRISSPGRFSASSCGITFPESKVQVSASRKKPVTLISIDAISASHSAGSRSSSARYSAAVLHFRSAIRRSMRR